LAAWPDHPLNAQGMTARRFYGSRQLDIPPLSRVADVEPVSAWIQQNMLVAACPDCAENPNHEHGLIWRDGPHLFLCAICGNAAVGKMWRPVQVPANLDAIEAALSCRPVGNRTWTTDQTADDLESENRRFGWVPVAAEVA
jgi:hypothetical protein